jgi:hypothetical protein
MRPLFTVSAVVAAAGLLLAAPAGADPSIEISSHTSAVVTELGLHGGLGYLTVDARIVDSAAQVQVALPGANGTWAVSGPSPCSSTSGPDGTLTIGCGVPRAGNYVWTVPVERTSSGVTGLTGSVGVAYPGPPFGPEENASPALTTLTVGAATVGAATIGTATVGALAAGIPLLDTFPIVDLGAPPANATAALIAGATAEVRSVETRASGPIGGLGGADLAVTLNVPTGEHPFAVDIELPIAAGTLWAATSYYPDRSNRWFCSMQTVAAGDTVQALRCASWAAGVGLLPMASGLHTLILHLAVIGPPAPTTGWVAWRPSRTGPAVRVDSFPAGPAQ